MRILLIIAKKSVTFLSGKQSKFAIFFPLNANPPSNMKRTSTIAASILGVTSVLMGQDLAFHRAGTVAPAARGPVVESGDLIPASNSAEQAEAAEDASEKFHFFEGFVSKTSQDELLAMVQKLILQKPDNCCEIVKEAILISEADEDLVAAIVETACETAPEKMRIIAQCAMAVSPNALPQIQQVLAKLDPGGVDFYFDEKSGLDKSGMNKGGMETGEVQGLILDTSPISNPIPQIPPDIPTISPPPSTNNATSS